MRKRLGIPSLILTGIILSLGTGFCFGVLYGQETVEPVIVTTKIIRYPTTPPYETFDNPIDYDQALALLYGMRASHKQALNRTFESDPGFGIADREFQLQCIKWYDQLIDFVRRNESN